MKQILYIFLTALIIQSCKKTDGILNQLKNANQNNGTIAVSTGYTLPSVVIGTQTWTNVNYNGAGGVSPSNPYNIDIVGKLYTHDEMVKVIPPTGFRIPTRADWEKLMRFLGVVGNYTNAGTGTDHFLTATRDQSLKLFSVTGWKYEKGIDTYSFKSLPSTLVPGLNNDEYEWVDYWGNESYYCNINFSSSSKLKSNTSVTSLEYDTSYTSFFSVDKACIRFVKDN